MSCIHRNSPLNFHCTALYTTLKAVFHRSNNKNKGQKTATYQGEQWEPMPRFSSIGKADMELCLPVPPQRERCDSRFSREQETRVNVRMLEECFRCVCLCVSHGMLLRMMVFAHVAPEWLCLTNKHIQPHTFPQLRPLFDMNYYNLPNKQAVPCSSGTTCYKKDGSCVQL